LIRTVEHTVSTNDDVAVLARGGEVEGFWLRAERQSGGKGRQGRSWESPVGNLYASTIVRLRPGDPAAPSLALVAAVALHETVSLHATGIHIKWPNDLAADGAKLAGILLEREGDAVIAGFGVNLAVQPDIPDRPVTSIKGRTGIAPDPDIVAEQLAAAFGRWLDSWRREGIDPVRETWLDRAHPIGTKLMTSEGSGTFDGLEPDGALRLRLADGGTRVIHAGDVFLI
jgi:BirA family transcriptional regulator, biotin operon repressor / biotin---[acetyl-CoA-carboxylase] ligase